MSYAFLDAYSSVQTAESSVVSGTSQRQSISIASTLTTVPVTFSGSPSISGAITVVGTPSISGAITVVGTPSISGAITVVGTLTASVVGGPISLFAPTASFVSGVTSIMTGTTPTSVLVAAGGSIKNYVTHILCTNAASNGTFVDIKDGGGNVLYTGYAAGSGGGFSSYIYPPLVGSANKSVDAAPRAQASVTVAMTGYTA